MPRLFLANLIVWACLFGAGVGAVQLVRAPRDAASAESRALPHPPGEVTWLSLDLPARGLFTEVTMRPLFSTTRRPPPDVEVVAAKNEIPSIMLTGITGRPGALRAIVVHPEEGVLHLERGAELAGWTVGDITLSGIEMRPLGGGADPVAIALGEAASGSGQGESRRGGAFPRLDPEDDGGGFGGLGYD